VRSKRGWKHGKDLSDGEISATFFPLNREIVIGFVGRFLKEDIGSCARTSLSPGYGETGQHQQIHRSSCGRKLDGDIIRTIRIRIVLFGSGCGASFGGAVLGWAAHGSTGPPPNGPFASVCASTSRCSHFYTSGVIS
jgi:hypothetical protein